MGEPIGPRLEVLRQHLGRASIDPVFADRLRPYQRVGDYSYGLYVYSFPVQQTLMQRFPGLEPSGLFALGLPLSLAVAALSWHLLEAPVAAGLQAEANDIVGGHGSSSLPGTGRRQESQATGARTGRLACRYQDRATIASGWFRATFS